ncbi:DUF2304 family protein [Candidatus Woesearchaeota archaeon]|nr:DUF2304 family protein [Candidatus Woesearchaeota archaeon]
MTPIQIIAILVTVFGILRAFALFRERRLTGQWLVFWLVIWGGLSVIAFLPGLASGVSKPFGVERGVDLIVYLSIILLFYLVFRIYLRLENLERNTTRLVREFALKKHRNSTEIDDQLGGIPSVLTDHRNFMSDRAKRRSGTDGP